MRRKRDAACAPFDLLRRGNLVDAEQDPGQAHAQAVEIEDISPLSAIARQLWYVRAYAAERQEPLQRHAVFLRMDWVDFLVPKLELSLPVLPKKASANDR